MKLNFKTTLTHKQIYCFHKIRGNTTRIVIFSQVIDTETILIISYVHDTISSDKNTGGPRYLRTYHIKIRLFTLVKMVKMIIFQSKWTFYLRI
jgi:hypothetical protein